jgi:uncharacterized metal-binding protein YceD (DUF177 family)
LKLLNQYSIPFTGLKIGKHQFNFEVDGRFFDEFEYSIVKKGLLNVDLVLERQETLMILDFHITGGVQLSCDRCLSDFPSQIETKDRLIAKFTESEDLVDSEVIVLNKNEIEINVGSFIYEMINLAVPYLSICEEPGNTSACDQEMLAKIAELSQGKEEESDDSDPRWDKLRNIRKN